jgi:hypothetical protein
MLELDTHPSGRHFLQIPSPTNVPDRVLRAIDHPTIDHRGPEFAQIAKTVLAGLKRVFQTGQDVVIYPASGTGAWEAALVNTLSPGDRVLMAETGHFATLWQKLAGKLGLEVEFLPGDWRHGADPAEIEKRLRADGGQTTKAVCVVHNETSTGVTTPIAPIRAAIDRTGHPALLLVDTISSLGSIDYRHDEWGVDVTVGGSQKGLMLPPGLSFNAISQRHCKRLQRRGCRARAGTGGRCWRPTLTVIFRTHRRPTCCTACMKRSTCCSPKASQTSSRATTALRRHATRGASLGTRDPVRQSSRIQFVADSDPDARRAQRRRLPQERARALQHVARARTRQGIGQDLSHRSSRLFQRPDAVRHAGRR